MDRKTEYIKQLFPNIINLKINKRVDKKDRKIMKQLHSKLLEAKDNGGHHAAVKVMKDAIKKGIFKSMTLEEAMKQGIKKGFSFRHVVRRYINSKYNGKVEGDESINGVRYKEGMELLCSNAGQRNKIKYHKNFIYKLIKLDKHKATLYEPLDNVEFKIEESMLMRNFELSNVRTVHSAQGDTVNEPYFIADWQHYHTSPEYCSYKSRTQSHFT